MAGETIPSFKNPFVDKKLVGDQKSSYNERKYRSRSPLQREESNSNDNEEKIPSIHEIQVRYIPEN